MPVFLSPFPGLSPTFPRRGQGMVSHLMLAFFPPGENTKVGLPPGEGCPQDRKGLQ